MDTQLPQMLRKLQIDVYCLTSGSKGATNGTTN